MIAAGNISDKYLPHLVKYQSRGEVKKSPLLDMSAPRPVYDNLPDPAAMRRKAMDSVRVDNNAALKAIRQKQGELKPATSQGAVSKVLSVLANPVSAASYVVKGQRIPDYFDKAETKPYDAAIGLLNPVNAYKDIDYGMQDAARGDYGSALLNLASGVSSIPSIPAWARKASPELYSVNKRLIKNRDYGTLAAVNTLAAADAVAPMVVRTPGLRDLYKKAAYNIASTSGGAAKLNPIEALKNMVNPGRTKEKYLGDGTWSNSSKRDLVRQYIYGDSPDFEEIDLKPFGLQKYYDRYGNMKVFKLNSVIPHGETIVGDNFYYFKNEIQNASKNNDLVKEKGYVTLPVDANYGSNPVRPIDNVAGHMVQFSNTKTPGKYMLTSQDIWKFHPEDYSKKWSADDDAPRDYITYLQAKLLERAGKPFILMQENPFIWSSKYEDVNNAKKFKKGGAIISSRGQWDYPGQDTLVPTPTGQITMQGVPYPVYGQDETGYGQMMYPGDEYQFPGQMVYEQPMLPKAQFGIPSFPASVPLTSMAAKLYNKFMTPSSKAPAPTVMKTVEPQDNLTQLYDMQNEAVGKFDSRFNVNDRLPSDSSQMLNLSSGRFRGAKVTSSLIKDIVASAKEQGVDPWVLLSVVGRESTYGSGTRDNRERAGSKKDLVSGWTVAEDYRGYDPERFLADRQVPGVRTIKDYHRWRYEVDDEDAVQNYLAKNPKILEQYKKKLSSLPDVGDMDAFDLAARKIKKKGLRNYNPGDPTYEKMVYDDMKLLKSDKEMAAMMKSLGYKNGGEHGGLDRWFAEKWVDIKTGEECGRDEGEKRRGYPACRPSRRVNEDTPKTASELSSSERERFKRSKTSSERINYQHQRKEDGGETNETDMANKPNNPTLWSRAKSMAKQKFDVYPSAYANGWAAKWYKSKGGTWSKAMYGMEVPMMEQGGKPEWLVEAQLKAQGYSGNALQQKMNSMAQGGEPSNEGFQALPEYVQEKIMSNMAFGGYLPEMFFGGKMKKNLQEAAPMLLKFAPMLFGAPPIMQKGGEPDGSMALGQIDAAIDKLNTLRKFIQPESDLEPWVSSKLTLMDHYTDAVSDYMQYNPEAQGEMMEEPQGLPMPEMKNGGGIPERYKNMGFTKVGVKKESTRPGKKWMVLAQKGNQYKVVHGGYDGMKDFTQHGSEKRRDRFWDRMGGKNSAKAKDPFSPLYWHKRFGTWEDGGEIQTYQEGGERGFLETASQFLPGYETYLDIRDIVEGAYKGNRAQMSQGTVGLGQPFSGKALTGSLDYVTEKLTNKQKADYISNKRSDIINMSEREKIKLFERYGRDGYDKWVKEGKPKLKKGGSTFSGNAWYEMGGGYVPEFVGSMAYQKSGPVEGDVMDVTPEQLEMLKAQGYEFEIL